MCTGAEVRYLANVARFAAPASGILEPRTVRDGRRLDGDFSTGPFYERSGADFSLIMCGCFDVTVVSTVVDFDNVFDPGETWVVRGRFFQRAGGYEGASAAFGGSQPQRYDPDVDLLFSHDIATNRTTVSLVYALTMQGAATLAGEPVQEMDFDVSNHTSIAEGFDDVVVGAIEKMLFGCTRTLTEQAPAVGLLGIGDPMMWSVTALVGMSYATQQDALFIWTDTGFGELVGDFNGDGVVDGLDFALFEEEIALRDGGPTDADGGCQWACADSERRAELQHLRPQRRRVHRHVRSSAFFWS